MEQRRVPGGVRDRPARRALPCALSLGDQRRRWDIGLWALAANAFLFVILLPAAPYADIYASSRVTTGVVVSFVIAIPALTQLRPSFRWVGAVLVVAWMAPWWVLYGASWFPYGRQPGESPPTRYLGVPIQGSATTALPGQEVDFTICQQPVILFHSPNSSKSD